MTIDQSRGDVIPHVSNDLFRLFLFKEWNIFVMLPQTASVVWTNWFVSYFGSLRLKIPPNPDALPHRLKMSHGKSSILFFFFPKMPPRVMFGSQVEVTRRSRPRADSRSQPQWPAYVSSTYVLLFRYAGGGGTGIGLRWTIHPSRQWREGGRERGSETAMETEWPQDDKYQQEHMNHKSSGDSKAAVLKRSETKSTRKWEINVVRKRHGYPTGSLSDLRLIGTHQCRQPPGLADHKTCELIYRSV